MQLICYNYVLRDEHKKIKNRGVKLGGILILPYTY